jgi:hypothetical protein
VRLPGRRACTAIAAILSLALLGSGCSSPPPKARAVRPPVTRDTPAALRGTVGSVASLTRALPVLVSGYGIVVGLPGTGGGDLDERIAATMERQLGLMGVGPAGAAFQGTELEGLTVRQVLRHRSVAVVVAYAAVVPGAPMGATFDVYVQAVSPSPDISLEGGTLYPMDLQIGPPTPFRGYAKKRLGSAQGAIFVNPFAAARGPSRLSENDGRVLGGGRITSPLDLQLVLDNESHRQASLIAKAINDRFPPGDGEGPTARGRTDRIVELRVPAAYREKYGEFINLLLHVQMDTAMPQEYARRYAEALKSQPFLADDLRWCLQALPQKAALPFLRELYDSTESRVRMSAIRAGAGLGDALVAPHLKRMAREGAGTERIEAIAMLGELAAGPTVDLALLEQLEARELGVRVAAYEALASRAEQIQLRRLRQRLAAMPPAARAAVREPVDPRMQLDLPGDTVQGVKRRVIEGKFLLDVVPRGEPVIYITQQGRPRIVLFGEGLEVMRPVLVSAWPLTGPEPSLSEGMDEPAVNGATRGPRTRQSTLDRLLLLADDAASDVRIMYRQRDQRDEQGNIISGQTITGKVKPDLVSLIEFLAHTPSPEKPNPGAAMTYSEVVGALYAFQNAGAIQAAFAVEDNVLRDMLMQAATEPTTEDRPETTVQADERERLRIFTAQTPGEAPAPTPQAAPEPTPMVVPLPPPKKKEK